MFDVLCIVVTVVLFALAAWFVRGCIALEREENRNG